MHDLVKKSWPLFLGITLIMVGSGLFGTLIGVRAEAEKFDTVVTGIIMSLYYGGFLAGTVLCPRLVQSVGHIRVFTALASLVAVTILAQGHFVDPLTWAGARVVAGFCFAGLYIVIESWMNDLASNSNRGKVMSTYLITYYGAMVIGQLLLPLAPPTAIDLFLLAAALTSLSLLPLSLSNRPAPALNIVKSLSLRELYRQSPLGVIALALSGLASGALFSIGPVYASQTGMTTAQIGGFMALFVIGGMAAQTVVGQISDKIDRRLVLAVISCLATALCLAAFAAGSSVHAVSALFFLLGAMALTIYPVASAYTNDRLEPGQYVAASGLILLVNGAGAFAGPFLATVFMSILGPPGFFAFAAIGFGGISAFALYRMRARPDKAVPTPRI